MCVTVKTNPEEKRVMKYLSALFLIALIIFVGASLRAQSLSSQCGSLSGDRLQLCIAEWQAKENRRIEEQRQFDDRMRDLREESQRQTDNYIRCSGRYPPLDCPRQR
jgi:hypothetical protein